MSKRTWLAIGQLGSSLVQVAASEWRAVRSEMRHSARLSAGAVVALAIGSVFLTVALIGILLALGEILSRWMPHWSALLLVSAVFVLAAAVLMWRARGLLRRVDTPGQVVKRRWRDHRGWMRRQLGGGTGTPEREKPGD